MTGCGISLNGVCTVTVRADTHIMSCFQVSVRLRVCSSHALSCLQALFHVGAWCSDPGTRVLVTCRGSDTRIPSCCVSVRSRVCSGRSSVHMCFFGVARLVLFLLVACIQVMFCAVWHAACVFHWLRAFMLSCLVWTRGIWVFSFAACSCPVLHMAGDLYFAGHVLVFCFVWAHGFCLSFLCAVCSPAYL